MAFVSPEQHVGGAAAARTKGKGEIRDELQGRGACTERETPIPPPREGQEQGENRKTVVDMLGDNSTKGRAPALRASGRRLRCQVEDPSSSSKNYL